MLRTYLINYFKITTSDIISDKNYLLRVPPTQLNHSAYFDTEIFEKSHFPSIKFENKRWNMVCRYYL